MKVLFISNLYPDRAQPHRGSDNADLLRAMARACEIRVLSPRPALGRGTRFLACPADEPFQPVYRPVFYVPKIGSLFNHRLMARGIRADVERIRGEFRFDVVLVSWVYPDACAAGLLASEKKFPLVVVAQGSDVHQYLQMPARRSIILESLRHAATIITRSGDLGKRLAAAGVEKSKLRLIYNGLNLQVFRPGDSMAAREAAGLPANAAIILYVGNFLPIKNPFLLLEAHAEVCRRTPGRPVCLVMIGSGPMETEIRQRADALGFGERVLLPGRKPAVEVARCMQAADVLCLSSNNEGFPNVILEAFACGLPVVSTDVGGISELLCHDYLGRLAEKGNCPALAEALGAMLARPPEKSRVAQYGAAFSWDRAASEYLEVLKAAVAEKKSGHTL